MNQLVASAFPVGLFGVAVIVPIFLIDHWRTRREKAKRSPLVAHLLRSPGESLRKELDDIRLESVLWFSITPATILMLFGQHLSVSYFAGLPETAHRVAISVSFGVAMFGYGTYKSFSLIRRGAKIRLGYEGEMAVAQELNQLMRQGVVLFHDVPADGFNIDHVLVGPNGVYAIETKARMKPKRDQGKNDARVVFDGKCLAFPTWQETEPLEQAAAQARWLARWLSSAVGESVEVRPALALPGWFVERTGRSEVSVFNPKNGNYTVKGWLNAPLSGELLRRIEHQLDQRCRDVEPSLCSKKKSIG